MKKRIDFITEMNEIDDKFIEEAGQPWVEEKQSVWYYIGKVAACIALILVLGAAVLIVSPEARAAAQKITIQISHFLGSQEDITPYTKIINTTKTVDGINITLKEAVLDDNCLYLLIQAEDTKKVAKVELGSDEVKINGKTLGEIAGSGASWGEESFNAGKNTQLLSYGIEGKSLPQMIENITLDFDVYREKSSGQKKTDDFPGMQKIGKVHFNFSASRKELEKNTRKYTPNLSLTMPDGNNICIQKVQINRVNSSILIKCDEKFVSEAGVYLKGHDDKGNVVCYGGTFYNKKKGTILLQSTQNIMNDKEQKEMQKKKEKGTKPLPDEDATYMTLQFYYPVIQNRTTTKEEDGRIAEEWVTSTDEIEAIGKEFRVNLIW